MHYSPITAQQSSAVKFARGRLSLSFNLLWCSWYSIYQVNFCAINERRNIIFRRTRLALIRRFGGLRPHTIFRTSICSVPHVASTTTGSSLFSLSGVGFIHQWQVTPTILQALLTLSMSMLSLVLTASLSTTVSYIYAATLVFVTFIAPGVLVWAQKYKKYALHLHLQVSWLIWYIARSEAPGMWLFQRLTDVFHGC